MMAVKNCALTIPDSGSKPPPTFTFMPSKVIYFWSSWKGLFRKASNATIFVSLTLGIAFTDSCIVSDMLSSIIDDKSFEPSSMFLRARCKITFVGFELSFPSKSFKIN